MRRLLDAARRLISPAAAPPTLSPRPGQRLHDAAPYPGVFGRIHRADLMIGGHTPELLAVYNRIGAGAYRVIETGLDAVGRRSQDVERMLDFGCGYGRVLRAIVQHIEPRRVDVFDVDSQGVEFCADEFGVTGLHFTRPWDWSSVPFSAYDLIWAGSVFTHLGEAFTREMLDLLRSLLRPGGVLVFSSHGDEAIHRAATGFFGDRFKAQAPRIQADYAARGFCFLPYEDSDFAILPFSFERRSEFGMTWMSEAYVTELVRDAGNGELQLVRFIPAAWEHMQDGVILQRPTA